MPWFIEAPARLVAAGTPPKTIEEFVGRLNSGHKQLSVARMLSPQGWSEPGQTPEFLEISLVLRGTLRVEHAQGALDVPAGSAVITQSGEWVRYATPAVGGAEYVSICLPAFAKSAVHRDPEVSATARP